MPEGACPRCASPLEENEITAGVIARACPSCAGVLYRREDLAAKLELADVKQGQRPCPGCGKPMKVGGAFGGALELDACDDCGVLWFDAGEIAILRKLTGRERIAMSPEERADAGLAARGAAAPAADAAPEGPPEMSGRPNPDEAEAPVVVLDGIEYKHFQTADAVTVSVLGEFPWVAKVGDGSRVRDFIAPPRLLSEDVTERESVWSAGEWLPPEEVWSAFALPGSPPSPTGVAPAQPNPWIAELPALWSAAAQSAAACVAAFVVAAALGARGAVAWSGSFTFKAADAERSRVSPVFELDGRTANAVVDLESNLDNHWAYANLALIEADTDRALDFGRELGWYHGYDDGESWSEGSTRGSVIVPEVPPGRYYLRLEAETDASPLELGVRVRRDVPLARLPLLALVALFAPLLWAQWRSSMFENARWAESDHPRATSSDDGDDE